jgi:hypothetical protein
VLLHSKVEPQNLDVEDFVLWMFGDGEIKVVWVLNDLRKEESHLWVLLYGENCMNEQRYRARE